MSRPLSTFSENFTINNHKRINKSLLGLGLLLIVGQSFGASLPVEVSQDVVLTGIAQDGVDVRIRPHPTFVYRSRSNNSATQGAHGMEKRASPAVILRTWFRIGRAAFEAYQKAVEENEQPGAGFHRDLEDLILSQLPEPPADVDQSSAPT